MVQTYLNPSLFSYYIPSHHHGWLVGFIPLFWWTLHLWPAWPCFNWRSADWKKHDWDPTPKLQMPKYQATHAGRGIRTSLGLTSPFLMFCFMGKWSLTWEIPSFQIARIPHSLNKLHHLKLSILNWLELVSTKLPCFCLWEWLKILDPHLRLGWSMTKRRQMLPAHWCPMSEPDPYGHFIGLTCKNRDLTGNDGIGGWYK